MLFILSDLCEIKLSCKFQNRIKVIALRTTSNINTIVKDLLHIPPIYKATVVPSWKSSEVSIKLLWPTVD